jgi:ribonuclease D
MNPALLIETPAQLHELARELANHGFLALDTESNSFYAYFERICLIQISTPTNDYIVDPQAVKDLSPLTRILDDPRREKIFHAASNDILGMKRDFGFTIRNLFDTAFACKLLGYKQLGLAKIIEKHFGITLNKKWQRHDWSRRPLLPEQLDYARLDTHFLIPLRHLLSTELQTANLWDPAREAFDSLCQMRTREKRFHSMNFLHIRGARALDSDGKRVLKALFVYREQEAQRRDRAPFRILTDDTLIRLAHERPQDSEHFSQVKGLPRSFREGSYAHSLLGIIRKHTSEGSEAEASH